MFRHRHAAEFQAQADAPAGAEAPKDWMTEHIRRTAASTGAFDSAADTEEEQRPAGRARPTAPLDGPAGLPPQRGGGALPAAAPLVRAPAGAPPRRPAAATDKVVDVADGEATDAAAVVRARDGRRGEAAAPRSRPGLRRGEASVSRDLEDRPPVGKRPSGNNAQHGVTASHLHFCSAPWSLQIDAGILCPSHVGSEYRRALQRPRRDQQRQ